MAPGRTATTCCCPSGIPLDTSPPAPLRPVPANIKSRSQGPKTVPVVTDSRHVAPQHPDWEKVSRPINLTYDPPVYPIWDDIKDLFKNPYFVCTEETAYNPEVVGKWWRDQMLASDAIKLDLWQYEGEGDSEGVRKNARTIYYHLLSGSMPIGGPIFPPEALRTIRRWYNKGCPYDKYGKDNHGNPVKPPPHIIKMDDQPKPLRTRQNILDMSAEDLQTYRERLVEIMNPMEFAEDNLWQIGALVHTNWCLHHQQAIWPWHRAHIKWLEDLIDFPIPYWNFFSENSADSNSPEYGIPSPFLEDTFLYDGDKTRNPLLWAVGRKGSPITRNPPYVDPGCTDETFEEYLKGIYNAMQKKSIGPMEGVGFPEPDKGVGSSFTQELEQQHDHLHVWCGGDMGDNASAAFDPLYWSFHANFDRLLEIWIQKHHADIPWSNRFPLLPFQGLKQITVNDDEQSIWDYTNIGNMVGNTKSLGYEYKSPNTPDYKPPESSLIKVDANYSIWLPWIVFHGAQCTAETLTIDVAYDPEGTNSSPDPSEMSPSNKFYIGRVTRLGMGDNDNPGRCAKVGTFNYEINAGRVAREFNLLLKAEPKGAENLFPVTVLVTYSKSGTTVTYEKWTKWEAAHSFTPHVEWRELTQDLAV